MAKKIGPSATNREIVVDFKLARVTAQGAARYEEEIDEGETAKVGTVYIQEGTFPSEPPEYITITIQTP
jgi:hypothetical protein